MAKRLSRKAFGHGRGGSTANCNNFSRCRRFVEVTSQARGDWYRHDKQVMLSAWCCLVLGGCFGARKAVPMRTIRCGVSLPFVALLAYSQVSLAADEARTWRIEGRVVDLQSRPVAEAIVFIPARAAKESIVTETTDADGHFQLDAPYPPNGLTLQAKVDHRAKLAYKILPWDIQHETPAANVELVLKPARRRAAEVVDDSDQPVRDATVVSVAGYMSVDRASTGADGRAKLRVPAD